jgi:hypothetical protein
VTDKEKLMEGRYAPHVYTAMIEVMRELGVEGIGKDRRNKDQGFFFRGVEDMMNALTPLLVKHKLLIFPRFQTMEHVERLSKSGGYLSDVYVKGEFDFVSALDGSRHTAACFGQGMDSADKATNKAMSGAFKYCNFFSFCVPTEGVIDDGDAEHPEPKGKEKDKAEPPPERKSPKRDARGPEDHDRRPASDDPREPTPEVAPKSSKNPVRPKLTPLPDGEEDQVLNWRVENSWPILLSDVVSAPDEVTLKMAFGTAYKWAKALPNENIGRNLLANVQEKYESKKKEMGL